MARKQQPTQEQIDAKIDADVKDAFRNVVRERDHLRSVMADRDHEIASLHRERDHLRSVMADRDHEIAHRARDTAIQLLRTCPAPGPKFNLNERIWIREALRVYIGTPAFDNDPEHVAQMGALLHKVVKGE